MNVTIEDAIRQYRDWVIGKTVRGQRVAGAEVTIDTNGPDDSLRWFLHVVFEENPASGESPERNLVERVFSEIPHAATIRCESGRDLRLRLVGLKPCKEDEWLLEDEVV